MRRVFLTLLPVLLTGTGCGQPTPKPEPVTAEEAASWAPSVSALAAYLSVYAPLALYDGQAPYDDPNCPVIGRADGAITITGGCVDSSGRSWTGSVSMAVAPSRFVTFTQFGSGSASGITTQTGSAGITDTSGTSRDFTLNLQRSDDSSINYVGHVEGGYGASTSWNGTGTFTARRGGALETVDATTTDEVFDSTACDTEPASGSTQIAIQGHNAVVTYNGSTDCDSDATAELSFDGQPSGTVTGVGCSIARRPHSRGARARALFVALFAIFVGARRALGTRLRRAV